MVNKTIDELIRQFDEIVGLKRTVEMLVDLSESWDPKGILDRFESESKSPYALAHLATLFDQLTR